MKRLIILYIALAFTGVVKIYSNEFTFSKDSLLNLLNTLPQDSSRLKVLYSLAYLEPMSPSCPYYLGKLLEEATRQNNKKYQCFAMYAHVVYYFNRQDEDNAVVWMNKLTPLALKHKFYNLYFQAKRAEITVRILKQKIEYSISEAQEMYALASKLKHAEGMSSAKLCLMTAYLLSGRYTKGMEAGFESYRLLPPTASLDVRMNVLQEIALASVSLKDEKVTTYLQEYRKVLDAIKEENKLRSYDGSYLLLESLYADYYLSIGNLDKARSYFKEMDRYFSPTSYIPSRGLYYYTYFHYYRIKKEYDKSLAFADSAVSLLSKVSDNGGINYKIERTSTLAEAGRLDEAIPLFRSLLAEKDSFYRHLSLSQMNEIHQMLNMEDLLLEKEQHKSLIHGISLALIIIALLILIPSTFRIYCVRRKLKKEEEEIRRLSRIAEEANEVKSHFLENMSYNIRIPLNNVLGFSQLMTTNPDEVDANQWKEYSEIIQTNSTELIQLVNDVLDLSRLEAGRTKWQIQDHDILPLCLDIIHIAEMRSEKQIEIEFRTKIESQSLQVDITRFTQVLLSGLTYTDPCEEKRKIIFFLQRDEANNRLVFRILNSPLADSALQTQKVEVRHSINRLILAYFKGTYTIQPETPEGPTVLFTYPYSTIK